MIGRSTEIIPVNMSFMERIYIWGMFFPPQFIEASSKEDPTSCEFLLKVQLLRIETSCAIDRIRCSLFRLLGSFCRGLTVGGQHGQGRTVFRPFGVQKPAAFKTY